MGCKKFFIGQRTGRKLRSFSQPILLRCYRILKEGRTKGGKNLHRSETIFANTSRKTQRFQQKKVSSDNSNTERHRAGEDGG